MAVRLLFRNFAAKLCTDMTKYPIGIQDFENLRQGRFVYVDKTELIYKLTRGHIYFLSRPRRFGKSLLVSTLKYYFQGRRDIFEFKLDGTAHEALQQIGDRGYARAYDADRRQLFLIGASFSSKTGTIEEWQTEERK